jgi:hypothetical protein
MNFEARDTFESTSGRNDILKNGLTWRKRHA